MTHLSGIKRAAKVRALGLHHDVCIHTLQLSNYPRQLLAWIIRFLFKINGLDVQLDNYPIIQDFRMHMTMRVCSLRQARESKVCIHTS